LTENPIYFHQKSLRLAINEI